MRPGVEMRRQALTFGVAVLAGLALLGVMGSQAVARTADANMSYHGESVMLHNTTYVVWWNGGVGFNSGVNDQTQFEPRTEQFLKDLEGEPYYHTLTQYYQTDSSGNNQYIGPYTRFGGSWQDSSPPGASQINEADAEAEVTRALDTNNWPTGDTTLVILFTPSGYSDCNQLGCSPDAFCGYHSNTLTHDQTPYIVVPAPGDHLDKCGAQYFWPADPGHVFPDNLWVQSKAADSAINIMSHEIFESVTDPEALRDPSTGNTTGGWWDDAKGVVTGEIGDKCAYVFDPFWALSGHGIPPDPPHQQEDATILLGNPSHQYVLQKEWSNDQSGCVNVSGIPDVTPEAATVTAKNADGSDYTIGTWTNQELTLTVHAADGDHGPGLNNLRVFTHADTGLTYSFTPDDDGIHVSTDPFAYNEEGAYSIIVQDSNYQGHTGSATIGPFKQDFTRPTLTGSPTTSPNGNGWYNGDVAIHWTCSDDASGISGSCPANSTITDEGSSQTASASVSDVAGNTRNATSSAVKIDRTAPTVSVSAPSPVHGSNGWFDAQESFPVQVGVSGNDALSGIDSFTCTLDGSPATVSSGQVAVSGDGTHTVSCTSTDKAGNASASASTATVKIDATAPTASCASADGAWHASNVTLACSASDGDSGLANSGDASFGLSTSVAAGTETDIAYSSSHQVCDAAGNCVTAGPVTGNKIDRKVPFIGCEGPDGGWHSSNVTLLCASSDGGSGLAVAGDSSFNLTTSVPAGSEDGNASTGSHQVCDNVGNCSTGGPITGNQIDRKAPSVGISFPGSSGTASSPVVLASPAETIAFSATDGGSGVASWTLTRYAAALSGGSCPGSFAVDAVVGGSSGGASLTDPETLAYGKCYYWTLASTDAVGNGSTTFTTGVVRLPKLAPTPLPLAFGSVQHGTAKKLVETFSNASGTQLKVTAVSNTGSAFHVVSGGTCTVGKVIAPFGSCTVNVTFAPTSKGSYTGTLTVVAGGDSIEVSLTGTGT